MIETNQHKKWIAFLCLFLLLVGTVPSRSEENPEPVTGILGAVPEETKILQYRTLKKEKITFMGIEFVTGELEGRKVVIALTGVGKVNAAMTTTLLLDHFRPTEVIFTGIAGGINPEHMPGDIVIGEKLAHHDLGSISSKGFCKESVKNPVNGKRNPTFIPSHPALVTLAQKAASDIKFDALRIDGEERKPKVTKGIIVTGDVFVASQEKVSFLAKEFNADVVEMEGAAVAQVCFQQEVPFVVLRSVSDSADQRAQRDLRQFYKTAARNSATLTIALVRELADRNRGQVLKKLKSSDNRHHLAEKVRGSGLDF